MKSKVIQLLKDYSGKTEGKQWMLPECEFSDVADDIVKLFAIPVVSKFVVCPHCNSKMVTTMIHYPSEKKDYQCDECKQYFC